MSKKKKEPPEAPGAAWMTPGEEDLEAFDGPLGLQDYRVFVHDIPQWSKCVGYIARRGRPSVTCWIAGFQGKYMYLMTCKQSLSDLMSGLDRDEDVSVCFDDIDHVYGMQMKHTSVPISLQDYISSDYLDYALLREEIPQKYRKTIKRYKGLGTCVEHYKPTENEGLTMIGYPDHSSSDESRQTFDSSPPGEEETKCMDFCHVLDMEQEMTLALSQDAVPSDIHYKFTQLLVLVLYSTFERAAGSPCFATGGKLVSMHTGGIEMYADHSILIYRCVQHMKQVIDRSRKSSLREANDWTLDVIDHLFPRLRTVPFRDVNLGDLKDLAPGRLDYEVDLDSEIRNLMKKSKSKDHIVRELLRYDQESLREFRDGAFKLVSQKLAKSGINRGRVLKVRQDVKALCADIYELYYFAMGYKPELSFEMFEERISSAHTAKDAINVSSDATKKKKVPTATLR